MTTAISDARKQMIKALKETVVPDLRNRGFKGTFPHFRRLSEKQLDIVTFQFNKWGGSFIVKIAKCSKEGVTMPWGKHIPPSKVTVYDLDFYSRIRLGEDGRGHWFHYDMELTTEASRFESIAKEVLPYLDEQAEKWWQNT